MITDVIVLEPDDALVATVERLAGDLDQPTRVVHCRDAGSLASVVAPPAVVIVGPSFASPASLAQIERQVRYLPGLEVVLAFTTLPDVPVEDLIATGASAIVDPSDQWELRATLSAAVTRSAGLATIFERATSGTTRAPRVYTVCSPTGGCGKTFYASNLAYLLATTSDLKVALVDLDLQFGEVTSAMRVRGRHTVADAVAIRDDRELDEMLPELLVQHESGVLVLPAPRDPALADTIQPADVTRVIDALARVVDVVVVDTPTGLTEPVLAAMDRSDHLFLVAALDLSSLRNLRLFVETLSRLRVEDDRLSLVLNKEAKDIGIEVKDLAKVFPKGFAARVPFDREVARLMNHGTTVLAGAPRSAVAAGLVEGLLPFLDADAAGLRRFAKRGQSRRGPIVTDDSTLSRAAPSVRSTRGTS
jgi:pilus assembly protein CpaE